MLLQRLLGAIVGLPSIQSGHNGGHTVIRTVFAVAVSFALVMTFALSVSAEKKQPKKLTEAQCDAIYQPCYDGCIGLLPGNAFGCRGRCIKKVTACRDDNGHGKRSSRPTDDVTGPPADVVEPGLPPKRGPTGGKASTGGVEP